MNWLRKHRPSLGTVFGFAALMVALGGVALAAIPDSNGTIHACYQKSNGNLRVVESAGNCRTSETAINWNQQGSPGGGANGDREIIARARSTSPVAVTASPAPMPLTGNTWTQDATATNVFFTEVTWTQPGNCTGEDFFVVKLLVDGEVVGEAAFAGGGSPQGQHTARSTGVIPYLLDPSSSTPRTLTATVEEAGINPTPPCGFTIDSLRINVAALD